MTQGAQQHRSCCAVHQQRIGIHPHLRRCEALTAPCGRRLHGCVVHAVPTPSPTLAPSSGMQQHRGRWRDVPFPQHACVRSAHSLPDHAANERAGVAADTGAHSACVRARPANEDASYVSRVARSAVFPSLQALSLVSSGPTLSSAVYGSVLTLLFNSTNEQPNVPTAELLGRAATVSGGPTVWNASVTVQANDDAVRLARCWGHRESDKCEHVCSIYSILCVCGCVRDPVCQSVASYTLLLLNSYSNLATARGTFPVRIRTRRMSCSISSRPSEARVSTPQAPSQTSRWAR